MQEKAKPDNYDVKAWINENTIISVSRYQPRTVELLTDKRETLALVDELFYQLCYLCVDGRSLFALKDKYVKELADYEAWLADQKALQEEEYKLFLELQKKFAHRNPALRFVRVVDEMLPYIMELAKQHKDEQSALGDASRNISELLHVYYETNGVDAQTPLEHESMSASRRRRVFADGGPYNAS